LLLFESLFDAHVSDQTLSSSSSFVGGLLLEIAPLGAIFHWQAAFSLLFNVLGI
jgi:hypothetical protein